MFSYLKRGKAFYGDVFKLALPIVLQNLITNSLGLVDTFMVGTLGEAPLAGVTAANIPIFVVLLIIFGIQSGSTVLISQHWGRRDMETINRVVGLGVYVGLAFSTLFALVMFFFPLPFMSIFTNVPEIAEIAASYGRIVGFSYIFNSITQVYIAAHRSMENPRLGLIILSISMCTNTFLNWVLIFGNLGAPKLGVEGAAIATLISRMVEFVVMVLYATFNKRFRIKIAYFLRPGRILMRQFFRYSTPVVINETFWGLGTALFPTIMGHMDGAKEILAAYAIAGNVEKVCTVAVFAVAGTAAIVVGREIGAGRRETVYEIGAALNLLAVIAGAIMGVVLIFVTLQFVSPVLYPIFGLSEVAQRMATTMLMVTFIVLPIRSFNSTNVVGVLRGGGDVRFATVVDLLPLWFVALPLSAAVGLFFRLDIFWVYIAMVTEQGVKFFFGLHRFRSAEWINDLTLMSYRKGDPS